MKIEIYINGRPVEEYPEGEMKAIKQKLTENAMRAAGYVRNTDIKKEVTQKEKAG